MNCGLIAILLLLPQGLPTSTVVARYRDGAVLQGDLDSFARSLGRGSTIGVRAQVEEMVLIRTLARRFDAGADAASRRRLEIQVRLDERRRIEPRLQDTLRLAAAPSPEEVRRVFDADPSAWTQPRLWRLENIFKRFPPGASAADRQRLRQEMEGLRARIAGGEELSAMAARESESETRLRGGRMGMVPLDRLKAELAAVVSGMKAGDLSPVIETADGVTLLRCSEVREARAADFEESRRRIAQRLGQERFTAAWRQLEKTLLEQLAPAYRIEAVREAGPATVVASHAEGGARRDLPWEEVAAYLASQGVPRPADDLTPEQLTAHLRQRILLEGYSMEAARRGLLEDATWKETALWKALETKARLQQEAEAERLTADPTEDEVRKTLDASKVELATPLRLRILSLKVAIDPSRPRSFYDQARSVGELLAAGRMTWEQAKSALGARAEERDHGWLSEADVFMLGANAQDALRSVGAGQSTRLLQEGRALYLYHVVAREDPRPMALEEARSTVRARLRAFKKLLAVEDLRSTLLQEQAIHMVS